jgi:hypothetical protein
MNANTFNVCGKKNTCSVEHENEMKHNIMRISYSLSLNGLSSLSSISNSWVFENYISKNTL